MSHRCAPIVVLAISCGGEPASEPPPDAGLPATVDVAAGPFAMGCRDGDSACRIDEYPRHTVDVSAFAIDTVETTQRAYAACVGAGVCATPACTFGSLRWDPAGTPDLPVTCVTWHDADAYCRWRGGHLPTEAEWEKAARGEPAAIYPWGDGAPTCAHANLAGCGGMQVGARAPAGRSPYGAFDLAGNVCEWVADWYAANTYAVSPSADPAGPPTGEYRTVRDGHYQRTAEWARSSIRNYLHPESAHDVIGFRCVRPL